MALPQNIEELFAGLPARLKAAQAGALSSVFHFDIVGPTGGQYTVALANGACTVDKGLQGDAKCLVNVADTVYMDIELGRTRPEMAFMAGQIKISNLPEMMTFMQLFERLA